MHRTCAENYKTWKKLKGYLPFELLSGKINTVLERGRNQLTEHLLYARHYVKYYLYYYYYFLLLQKPYNVDMTITVV